MSLDSIKNKDQTGTPYGIRRQTTDSGELTDFTPVVGIGDKEGNQISPDHPFPTSNFDNAHRGSANSIFGDKITGTRVPSIAGQFQYGLRADDAVIDNVGSGNTSFSNAMLLLNTGTDSNGHIGIQGTDYLRYIPGHEAYAFFTCVFSAGVASNNQRVGIFDYDGGNGNGFFIGYKETQFGVTRRRAGVDTFTPVDVSTVFPSDQGTFDPTKGNVYKISYGYLGFATIHFEVLLPHGGFVEMASIDYPNSSTETHIANTNIPLRAEATNSGNTTDIEMKIGSVTAGIVDGGGADPIARVFTFAMPTTTLVAGVTKQLVHFRNKSTYFSITNKISTQLILISASTDGNKTVAWGIKKNPTITTAGTWADISVDSVMEYSTDAVTDLNTGGDLILWNLSKIDSFFEDVEKYLIKLRPTQWATIYALSAGANDVDLSIRWKELF
jgi:hypothetical protein